MQTEFNEIQTIKRSFFAYRNGVIADTLRKSGDPHRIIFGLNLPQIREIAAMNHNSRELAMKLWANDTTRESQLLSPMLYPADLLDDADLVTFIKGIKCAETADILCHFLLRKCDYKSIITQGLESDNPWGHYVALRLSWQLLVNNKDIAKKIAAKETDSAHAPSAKLAQQLLNEISFLEE